MIRRIKFIALVLCVLLGTAGFLSAQRSTGPTHPPFKVKANPFITITTRLGYQAAAIGSGVWPTGIGVSTRGDTIFFGQDYDSYVYRHHDHTVTPTYISGDYVHALRQRGALYIGEAFGDVYKITDKDEVKYLGHDQYGDDVSAIDVDLATGIVYFISNYWEYDYTWSGLYKLPPNTEEAILMDWWEYEPSYGLAVKGNLLYITDFENGSIWTYPKFGGPWKEIVTGLGGPADICFDKLGNMFVTEGYRGSIARIKAGTHNIVRIAEGFDTPYYLQLDAMGNIYFTDYWGWNIWRLRK